ncbi:membrane-spanning 4-domains subfamily A member 10-like isoform X2 [Eublepharis macularius]|uniref:Membrane-spanning 4-domains subfamily A member 10-like isoform X2 n=1 Tax=Eublepharis macularius TaxID=481883 RepID=A0AA97IVU9_EUBMA|nr:membrane-spanning 4-domains subfamily A member 10-like isoform X2 [Eublepharis macularius]
MIPPGTSPANVIVGHENNEFPRQKTYPKENEARGAVQIVIAMIHVALGCILLFAPKEFSSLMMSVWYPFWGAGLFFISGYLASKAAKNTVDGLGILCMMLIFSSLQCGTAFETLASKKEQIRDRQHRTKPCIADTTTVWKWI